MENLDIMEGMKRMRELGKKIEEGLEDNFDFGNFIKTCIVGPQMEQAKNENKHSKN